MQKWFRAWSPHKIENVPVGGLNNSGNLILSTCLDDFDGIIGNSFESKYSSCFTYIFDMEWLSEITETHNIYMLAHVQAVRLAKCSFY